MLGLKTAWEKAQAKKNGERPTTEDVITAFEGISFPTPSTTVAMALGFIALTTTEGHFITPTIVGRRVSLNPLLVFLGLAFWTWLWGPIGALLAVPLSIIGLVIFNHHIPDDDVRLPDKIGTLRPFVL